MRSAVTRQEIHNSLTMPKVCNIELAFAVDSTVHVVILIKAVKYMKGQAYNVCSPLWYSPLQAYIVL